MLYLIAYDIAHPKCLAKVVDLCVEIEGRSAAVYFSLWAQFLPEAFPFERRSRRPEATHLPDDQAVLPATGSVVKIGQTVVLEECTLTMKPAASLDAKWVTTLSGLIPDELWKKCGERLVVVSDGTMSYFATHACEAAQHVRIDDATVPPPRAGSSICTRRRVACRNSSKHCTRRGNQSSSAAAVSPLLWLVDQPGKFSAAVKKELAAPHARVHVSALSAWELGIKVSKGKLSLPVPVSQWFSEVLKRYRLVELAITADIAAAFTELPPVHGDPFDLLNIP
jgi:PIN domain nuclease of toxin-antitoxin system